MAKDKDFNICTLTDSYKLGHYSMYPDNTEYVYSYFESRTGAKFNKTNFFGLQYLRDKYLTGRVVTKDKIAEAKYLADKHMGKNVFNEKGWSFIEKKYDGHLPLKIQTVPEGLAIPTNNVLMDVINTDSECWWLTNYVESLLTHAWSSSTICTLSRECKMMFIDYLNWTSVDSALKDHLPFMLHDFGFRGVSSVESAAIGGAGHLANFSGTDTLVAIETAMKYYKSDVCAYSVNATEHSIMTSLGEKGEFDILKRLINYYPKGILSIVIDSYDYKRFINDYARELKSEILNRDGKTVFRPDSGEPVSTTLKVFELLESVFGSTVNNKGYKILNPKIGVLWGDGIDYIGIRNVLHAMMSGGWAASNIIFGMGGGLLQKINRDTQCFAFKSSAQCRNGKWHDICKSPIDITKKSKLGKQYLYRVEGSHGNSYTTTNIENKECNILIPVFGNGKTLNDFDFEEVKHNTTI